MRWLSAARHELVFHYRARIVHAYVVVTLLFIGVVRFLPADLRSLAVPVAIFSELATMGTFFVCGVVMLERSQGTLDSLMVTPLRLWEYLTVKSSVFTLMGAAASFFIAFATSGLEVHGGLLVVGVALTSCVFLLLGLMISARVADVSQFFVRAVPRLVPVVLLLYFVPALDYLGVNTPTVVALFPGTAALTLIGGAFGTPLPDAASIIGAVVLLVAWVGIAALGAATWFRRYVREKGHEPGITPPAASGSRAHRIPTTTSKPTTASRVLSLLRADLRSTLRDPLLLMPAVVPVLLALFVEYAVPWMRSQLLLHWEIDILPYYDFVTSAFILLIPLVTGAVVGFMILDERDEGTLLQLSVSPLGKAGYLRYRMAMPTVVGFVMGTAAVLLTAPLPISPGRIIAVMLVSSIKAPLMTLFLGTYSPSKVEGIALSKVANALILVPIAVYFIPVRWELAMLPFGPYWVMRAVQVAAGPASLFYRYIAVTAAVNLSWLAVLSRSFSRRAT